MTLTLVNHKLVSFVPCKRSYQWLPAPFDLTLRLGSKLVARFRFPGAELDAPTTRLTWPLPALDWRYLPSGICAATIDSLPVKDRVRRLFVVRGGVAYLHNYEVRHFIDLRDSFTLYKKKLAKKPRSNLTRAVRRFAEYCDGAVDFREYRTTKDIVLFAELANAISLRANKPRVHGYVDNPEDRENLIDQAKKGLVRGYVLFYRDYPISYIYCINKHENIIYEKIGYNVEYKHLSPGTVALYCLLERLFCEGEFEYLDFTRLETPFKRRFATLSIPCYRVAVCRFRPKLLAAIALHWLWEKSLRAVVGLSQGLRIMPIVKNLTVARR